MNVVNMHAEMYTHCCNYNYSYGGDVSIKYNIILANNQSCLRMSKINMNHRLSLCETN